MVSFVKWIIDPLHMVFIAWIFGGGTGYVIGRALKTRPIEEERDKARADVRAVLRTIELKQLET